MVSAVYSRAETVYICWTVVMNMRYSDTFPTVIVPWKVSTSDTLPTVIVLWKVSTADTFPTVIVPWKVSTTDQYRLIRVVYIAVKVFSVHPQL